MRLELLMKEMSEKLRLKIATDTGKDPLDKTEWNYDDLEEAIRNHAVVPVDPAVLTKDMHKLTRGNTIDETNGKIEDWLEAIGHASKAKGNKSNILSAADKEIEVKRFENKEIKDTIK